MIVCVPLHRGNENLKVVCIFHRKERVESET